MKSANNSKIHNSKFDGIYIITESAISQGRDNAFVVEEAIKGGANWIQLREKKFSKKQYFEEAKKISKICKKYGVVFIVNDYVDIACDVDADGVHLGQEDISIAKAKTIATKKLIYGKSTHSLQQALEAQKEGADYISIGPVFKTRAKPYTVGIELIKEAKPMISIPFVAIGGINFMNITRVLETGARWIAMISAIVSSENIQQTTAEYVKLINKYKDKCDNHKE